jgi:hypothetical protein
VVMSEFPSMDAIRAFWTRPIMALGEGTPQESHCWQY